MRLNKGQYRFTKKHFFLYLEDTCCLIIKLGYLAEVLGNIFASNLYTNSWPIIKKGCIS